ncbi:MAG: prefoldin subunit beta [Canidatus Methanoxibalbensis ujae]|nr:prefoldin subunit beta [Candidatus Methanoxibalbensis ujae]MCW7077713.1 prefoldin subunit beta [Candidatus Methanoxibalbensis ujae]
MAEEIPPQLRNQLAQLQQLRMQLETVSRQKLQVEAVLRDTESALEELEHIDDNAVIYRGVGEILVRTSRDKVKEELKEKKETFDLRLKTLERQEERMQKRFQQIQQQIREALGGEQVSPAGG